MLKHGQRNEEDARESNVGLFYVVAVLLKLAGWESYSGGADQVLHAVPSAGRSRWLRKGKDPSGPAVPKGAQRERPSGAPPLTRYTYTGTQFSLKWGVSGECAQRGLAFVTCTPIW